LSDRRSSLREKVYYGWSTGKFRRLHQWSGPPLIAFFLAIPWLTLGGERFLRIDILARRLDLMGFTFGATDTRFILVIALTLALSLGLLAAVAGRIWCGWLCPQTVFLEGIIRPIERWIEGERGERMRRDRAPLTTSTVLMKTLKNGIFALTSLVLALTFVSVFGEPVALWTGKASVTAYAFVAGFTLIVAVDLIWFRELFCNNLCPYARIQSVLMDEHSWVIAYDRSRGEPRLVRKSDNAREVIDRGGCIDCNRCVTVCPQAIDIRNGLQIECIGCGHCIDACTEVLGRHGHPTLISYTTEAVSKGETPHTLRARPVAYAVMIAIVLGLGLTALISRGAIDARFTPGRHTEPSLAQDGREQNHFDVHLWNHSRTQQTFRLSIDDWDDATIAVPATRLVVPAGEHSVVPLFVLVPPEAPHPRVHTFTFVAEAGDTVVRREANFIRPAGVRPNPATSDSEPVPAVDPAP